VLPLAAVLALLIDEGAMSPLGRIGLLLLPLCGCHDYLFRVRFHSELEGLHCLRAVGGEVGFDSEGFLYKNL